LVTPASSQLSLFGPRAARIQADRPAWETDPVLNNVVVTYAVHPEAKAEHVRLIEAVFAQLRADLPDNIDYQVMCLADGVTFVHMSTADTPDGSNPIPELAAFKAFSRDIADRVTAMPTPAAGEVVGSYHGRIEHA
jgi:hypothetical protein